MKRIAPLSIVFALLFYNQGVGINFFIFTVLLTLAQLWGNRNLLRSKAWLLMCGAALFTAVFCWVHGSNLAWWMNVVSLLLLSVFSFNQQSSISIQWAQGLISFLGAPGFLVADLIRRMQEKRHGNKFGKVVMVVVIPFCIAVLFFFIYKAANPVFASYTRQLNLNFINVGFVFFLFWGGVMMYAFFKNNRVRQMDLWECSIPDVLNHDSHKPAAAYESPALKVLFVLLNVMLLFITVLDIKYLYLENRLPEGISHKQFVHNGVGMLMLSVFMGIALLLWFFRGALNFEKGAPLNKGLVYLWLFLNIFMVLSTCIRNFMYVHDGLLTYKRLGVFLWLFFSATGLVWTAFKIYRRRTNWFLVKANVNSVFAVLVLMTAVDWDKFISDFNVSNVKQLSILDKGYLLSLSETNLALMYAICDSTAFETDSVFHYGYSPVRRVGENRIQLDKKLFAFLKEQADYNWPSGSLRRNRIVNELSALAQSAKVSSLNLSYTHTKTLEPVLMFRSIKKLNICCNEFADFAQLKAFPLLEELHVWTLSEADIPAIKQLKKLKYLYVANMDVQLSLRFQDQLRGLELRKEP